MSKPLSLLKYLEERVALALARALAALSGIISLSNHHATTNGAAFGPGPGPFSFGQVAILRTGKARIWGGATVTGTTIVAGDVITARLFVNGTPFGSTQAITALTGAGPTSQYPLSLAFEDSETPGNTQNYAIEISLSAHTASIDIGAIWLMVTELPG